MTYDPYQTHSAFGGYPGLATPFQSPYMPLNPLAALTPLATAYPPMAGIPNPHLAQILAARAAVPQLSAASPWATGLNNPLLAAAVLQNPFLAATLENPLVNPIFTQTPFGGQPYPFNPHAGQTAPQFGQSAPQFGQGGSPYGGSPYGQIGSMLPPQSWVGQPGLYGQPSARAGSSIGLATDGPRFPRGWDVSHGFVTAEAEKARTTEVCHQQESSAGVPEKSLRHVLILKPHRGRLVRKASR